MARAQTGSLLCDTKMLAPDIPLAKGSSRTSACLGRSPAEIQRAPIGTPTVKGPSVMARLPVRAEDGIRTRDLLLGKEMLYH